MLIDQLRCCAFHSNDVIVEKLHLSLQPDAIHQKKYYRTFDCHGKVIMCASAYVPTFIADYNQRFAKPGRNDFNVHRAIRPDEMLDLIFKLRETRRVSHSLTVQYDKVLYLLNDTPASRRLIGKYIDVHEYPDGHIEPRANETALPYTAYNRLSEVSNGAMVENRRFGHILDIAQLVQD